MLSKFQCRATTACGSTGHGPKWTLFDPAGILNALTDFLVWHTVRKRLARTTFCGTNGQVPWADTDAGSFGTAKNAGFGQCWLYSIQTVRHIGMCHAPVDSV